MLFRIREHAFLLSFPSFQSDHVFLNYLKSPQMLTAWSVLSREVSEDGLYCDNTKFYSGAIYLVKLYHMKVLLNSFHLNSQTLGFHPHT